MEREGNGVTGLALAEFTGELVEDQAHRAHIPLSLKLVDVQQSKAALAVKSTLSSALRRRTVLCQYGDHGLEPLRALPSLRRSSSGIARCRGHRSRAP
jgi:hypothetical protein